MQKQSSFLYSLLTNSFRYQIVNDQTLHEFRLINDKEGKKLHDLGFIT